jgi:sugar/nucleoside kinase (ribokinase family)
MSNVPTPPGERRGIACAGNWIVDNVKIIDTWPQEETLANILSESRGTGGAPYNVLVDLALMGAPFPLHAVGVLGKDPDGDAIEEHMRSLGIASTFRRSASLPTSHTDVMSVKSTGRRTFFHNRGPNAEFGPSDIPWDSLDAAGVKILHLGYLLLLESMDAEDPDFGTAAARALAEGRRRGIITTVDVVSESSDRFQRVARPALPHTDYLICNEIEAGRIAGVDIRKGSYLDDEGLARAAKTLLEMGVNTAVVIHVPEGGYVSTREGQETFRPSLQLPEGFIASTVGAGDAFAAGFLYGTHEGWSLDECLRLAVCAGAACLSGPTTTDGMRPLADVLALAESHESRT